MVHALCRVRHELQLLRLWLRERVHLEPGHALRDLRGEGLEVSLLQAPAHDASIRKDEQLALSGAVRPARDPP